MSGSVGKLTTLLSTTVLLVGLSACESNGSTRFSSVGSKGPQGVAGPQGPAGPTGPAGPAGSGGGLGSAGALALGGLVGPGGVAGTGLLANTGDPNSRIPAVSGVLVAAGGAVQTVAGQGTILADLVDSKTPGAIPVAGTVIKVVEATGQALVRTGNGQEYLVDGLTAATGQLVSVTVGNAQLLGSSSQTALIGGSLLSPTQTQGEALTVGLGSAGELLTLGTEATGGSSDGGSPVGGVVETVTGLLPGVVPGSGGGGSTPPPVTNPVQGVVQGVTGLLGGPGGQD